MNAAMSAAVIWAFAQYLDSVKLVIPARFATPYSPASPTRA